MVEVRKLGSGNRDARQRRGGLQLRAASSHADLDAAPQPRLLTEAPLMSTLIHGTHAPMTHTSSRARRWLAASIVAACAITLGACKADKLLNSDAPDVIDPGALNTAQGAVAQYNGAMG